MLRPVIRQTHDSFRFLCSKLLYFFVGQVASHRELCSSLANSHELVLWRVGPINAESITRVFLKR